MYQKWARQIKFSSICNLVAFIESARNQNLDEEDYCCGWWWWWRCNGVFAPHTKTDLRKGKRNSFLPPILFSSFSFCVLVFTSCAFCGSFGNVHLVRAYTLKKETMLLRFIAVRSRTKLTRNELLVCCTTWLHSFYLFKDSRVEVLDKIFVQSCQIVPPCQSALKYYNEVA